MVTKEEIYSFISFIRDRQLSGVNLYTSKLLTGICTFSFVERITVTVETKYLYLTDKEGTSINIVYSDIEDIIYIDNKRLVEIDTDNYEIDLYY
jgi:hypothetical protein